MKAFLEALRALFKSNPNASDEDVRALEIKHGIGAEPEDTKGLIATLISEMRKTNQPPNSEIDALKAEIKTLTDALSEEVKQRKEASEAVEAQRKREQESKKEEWLKKHTEGGRIAPKNEDDKKFWSDLYDKDPASAEIAINKVSSQPPDGGDKNGGKEKSKTDGTDNGSGINTVINGAKEELSAIANKWNS